MSCGFGRDCKREAYRRGKGYTRLAIGDWSAELMMMLCERDGILFFYQIVKVSWRTEPYAEKFLRVGEAGALGDFRAADRYEF